jgi:hypothetical protein
MKLHRKPIGRTRKRLFVKHFAFAKYLAWATKSSDSEFKAFTRFVKKRTGKSSMHDVSDGELVRSWRAYRSKS